MSTIEKITATERLLETRRGIERLEYLAREVGFESALAVTVRIATGLRRRDEVNQVVAELQRRIDTANLQEVA